MIEAINEYGTIKGIKMGLIRLKKCHPKGDFGYDAVPKKGETNEKN
jgi:putative component of membrane protein insertase Oxa1/YidC/SpoIIIJ protein YidD